MNDLSKYMQVRILTTAKEFTVDLSKYLGFAGINSLEQVKEIETSLYFPPGEYKNTGRTAEMPDTYQCTGSGSCQMLLQNGENRALSVALFHDTSMHDGTEHMNAFVYGWPVDKAEPSWTNKLGECHRLPVGQEITLIVAPHTHREKRTKVRAEPKTNP